MTTEELHIVAKEVADILAIQSKEVMTAQEAARYIGVRLSHLYRLTMQKEIPYYKPRGKVMYFKRAELDNWVLSKRIPTNAEISQQAQTYCKGGRTL